MFDHTPHRRIFIFARTWDHAARVAQAYKIPFVKWDHLHSENQIRGFSQPVVLLSDESIIPSELERILYERGAQIFLEDGSVYD